MLKKDKLGIIRKFYPNAFTTIDTVNRVIDYVEDQLNLEPTKIMLADSICSDDVNSIQYPIRSHEFLGPFKMGGLDGFPFTGLTGMAAFASHVPDEGAVFIYYGPHIGISKEGVLGEIHRFGQKQNTGCCGAASSALGKLLNNAIEPGNITEMDYQMNTIEQILYKHREHIINAKSQLHEATEIIYQAIDKRIQELVALTHFNCRYIIIMGAVLINSDTDIGSFSSARRFDILNVKENTREDLLSLFSV
ncbi:hypothetical protein [Pedobacter foliorum]|uniref:hypothetical protein n=1 Tax=Pedobacter foliorum TaxID=2739058 RepID=UPI001566A2A7|nr:hypothetical protein [Pedobacter foliorum]NRF37171.1 hypothetical protein [Pedobacter foliorum]